MKKLKDVREKIDQADQALIEQLGELITWLKSRDFHRKKVWGPEHGILEDGLIAACVSHGQQQNKALEPIFVAAVVTTIINYGCKHDLDLVAASQTGSSGLAHLNKVINVLARRLDLALDVERIKRDGNCSLFNRQRETEVINAAIHYASMPKKGVVLDKNFVVTVISMVIDFCTKKEIEARENA